MSTTYHSTTLLESLLASYHGHAEFQPKHKKFQALASFPSHQFFIQMWGKPWNKATKQLYYDRDHTQLDHAVSVHQCKFDDISAYKVLLAWLMMHASIDNRCQMDQV